MNASRVNVAPSDAETSVALIFGTVSMLDLHFHAIKGDLNEVSLDSSSLR